MRKNTQKKFYRRIPEQKSRVLEMFIKCRFLTHTFTWPDQISLRKYVFYLACSQQINTIKGVIKKPFYLIPFNKIIKRVMTNECSEKQEYSDIFY